MEAARVAETGDLARMAELARLAVEEAVTRRGGQALVGRWAGAGEPELRDGLAMSLSDADTRAWVGTIDDAVVGVTLASAGADGAGRIPIIFVEPEGRGVGVGEAMLDAAATWLGERGCAAIDVNVLPGDRDTKQFFEAAGMVARLLIMSRSQ